MWWFDRLPRPPGTWAGLIMTVLLAFAAAACGFRPLHGPPPRPATEAKQLTTAEQLGQIRILPLKNREGQRLHNLLRDRLNPAGQPRKPAYALALTLTSTIQQLGIRKDETATRANLILRASYVLQAAGSTAIVTGGRVRSINSYNILDAFFATTIAEDDALKRGLREIANNIALRLAVHFAAAPDAAEADAPDPGAAPPGVGDGE